MWNVYEAMCGTEYGMEWSYYFCSITREDHIASRLCSFYLLWVRHLGQALIVACPPHKEAPPAPPPYLSPSPACCCLAPDNPPQVHPAPPLYLPPSDKHTLAPHFIPKARHTYHPAKCHTPGHRSTSAPRPGP